VEPKLIIIRGFPASGKSTIAHGLRKRFEKAALFNADYFIHIIGGSKRNKEDKNTMFDLILLLSKELSKKKYTIIIEELFIFQDEIEMFINEFNKLDYQSHIFTLISPLDKLIQNDNKRTKMKRLGEERLKYLCAMFQNLNTINEGKIIDTNNKTINDIINQLFDFIIKNE